MTGTAKTEEREFKNTYGLIVVVIPPNEKLVREDEADIVFMRKEAKIKAIVDNVLEEHKTGRPILIGTSSVESSMEIADALYRVNVKYSILNAKNHEKESEIISNAGKINSVTIATNMAGRGTDIMLGGNREDYITELINSDSSISKKQAIKEWEIENKKINDIGGLFIIGVERNISRRIDNQLIGRAGRQGDNGGSQFYLSLDDSIIKDFGLQKIEKIWKALSIPENEPVQNITIDMNISAIQKRIEASNEEARKMVLSFDDINEEQRSIIYELRNRILNQNDSLDNFVINFTMPQIAKMVQKFANDSYTEEHWDLKGLENYLEKILAKKIDIDNWFKSDTKLSNEDIIEKVKKEFKSVLSDKKELFNENYNQKQKETMLKVIDEHWSLQLSSLTELKNRVFFRSYAQEKPLEEYQKEIFKEFKEKINNMEEDFILSISHMELTSDYKNVIQNFRLGLSPILTVGI